MVVVGGGMVNRLAQKGGLSARRNAAGSQVGSGYSLVLPLSHVTLAKSLYRMGSFAHLN